MIRFALKSIPAFAVAGVLGLCAAEPSWPAVTKEMRPWAYNWWMGCAVDGAGLELQARQFADAGMGGFHVIPIYEAKDTSHRPVEFLSEEWTRLFNMADEAARTQGLGVDCSMGCGWCFGGPWIEPRHGVWRLQRVAGGKGRPKTRGARLLWKGADASGAEVALYAVPTGLKVKRAPASGKGLMIDPFSPDAMREHLKPFAAALDRPGAAAPRAFYHDSYEYYGSSWTPRLFEAFLAKRGYDLRGHLPALAGVGAPDEVRRVKHDYRETLSDLVIDTFAVWADWCRARGITTRNEAHGAPANWLDFYALSDIPETEMFNTDRDILVSKFASSAAHVKGTRLVASESCTWINEHFNATLGETKRFLDQLILSGVNHVFYHGCCYSPADAAWPGWCFYASLEMNPRNPIWRDASILNAWLARVQSLAQTSEPDEDALVYWTLHDYWRRPQGEALAMSVHGRDWLHKEAVGATARRLYAEGVAFDFVSDRQLAALARQPKRKWNTIVVPDCETMPVGTAQSLASLSKMGYKIVFDGRRPADVPGLKDVETGRAAVAQALAAIPSADVKTAVRREPFMEERGLAYTRFRRGEDTLYYVVNISGGRVCGAFRPSAKTGGAWILDPMDGTIGRIAVKDGAVELALEMGESAWLWCAPSGGPGSAAAKDGRAASSSSITLAGPWTLTPVCGGPDMEKGWPRTMKTLASWARNEDGSENPFCGTVCYRTTFTMIGDDARKGATLDLGRVCESARVRVNGVDAGARIMPPYRVKVPAGAFKKGENVLEVEVTNVGANRIRDLDRRRVQWKIFNDINIVGRDYRPFDASRWPLRDAGLLGPVRLLAE